MAKTAAILGKKANKMSKIPVARAMTLLVAPVARDKPIFVEEVD